jgi:hypothetical protein
MLEHFPGMRIADLDEPEIEEWLENNVLNQEWVFDTIIGPVREDVQGEMDPDAHTWDESTFREWIMEIFVVFFRLKFKSAMRDRATAPSPQGRRRARPVSQPPGRRAGALAGTIGRFIGRS